MARASAGIVARAAGVAKAAVEGIVCSGRPAALKLRILAIVLLGALAPGLPALELSGGVRLGAGGSLLYGGYADDVRAELESLGAAVVRNRLYPSWRLGGWIEVPLLAFLSVRVEPCLGPVGGALLASDGYDLLVGVTGLELAVPALAATRIRLPAGELVLGAGVYVAGAVSVREVRNDGVIRSEGEIAAVFGDIGLAGGAGYVLPIGPGAITADLRVLGSLFSIASPLLPSPLHNLSIELTAGWAFLPRGVR